MNLHIHIPYITQYFNIISLTHIYPSVPSPSLHPSFLLLDAFRPSVKTSAYFVLKHYSMPIITNHSSMFIYDFLFCSWGKMHIELKAQVLSAPFDEFWKCNRYNSRGFPDSLVGRESACSAGDLGSIPGSGKFPGEKKWQITPVCLPGQSHGQRSLAGYSPWGCKSWIWLSDYITQYNPSPYQHRKV